MMTLLVIAMLFFPCACGGAGAQLRGGLWDGPNVGEFLLPSQYGHPFRLSRLTKKGPALLLFFPSGWCPSCRNLLSQMERQRSDYEKLGASLAGISIETQKAGAKIARTLDLEFPLLTDLGLIIARTFGITIDGDDIALPTMVIVSKERQIVYKKAARDIVDSPRPEQILTVLQTLARYQ
jgi:peroxiredoxin